MLLGIALCHSFRFLRCSALCSSRRRYRKRYANSPFATRRESVPFGYSFRDSTRAANCAAWSFAGKTRPPEEFSTRLLLRIPSDAYKKKKHRYCGVSLFMVHLNRLANKKKLIIAFWSGVRQSKESREPKTCGGEVRRLCDSDVRTRALLYIHIIIKKCSIFGNTR